MSEHELWNELGNLYFMSGAYDQAIVAYSRSIQTDDSYGKPYSNLALVYVRQGKYDEAVKFFRRSLDLLIEPKERAISWNRLGKVYRQVKDYQQAVIAFQQADELDPESREVGDEPAKMLYASADLSEFLQKYAGSLPDLKGATAAELDPTPVAPALEFIDEALVSDEVTEAADLTEATMLEEGISSETDATSLTTWLDIDLADEMEASQTFSADTDIDLFSNITDGHDAPIVVLEDEPFDQNRLASEHGVPEEALIPLPVEPLNWQQTPGPSLTHPSVRGDYSKAEQLMPVYGQDVAVDVEEFPVSPIVPMEKCEIEPARPQGEPVQIEAEEQVAETASREALDLEKEIAKYKRVVQVNDRNASAWDALGTLYKSAGLYKESIQAHQQAISIDPNKPSYHHHLGLAFAGAGRDEDAIASFQRVTELDPDHYLAHASLGGYYRKLGLEELAQKHIGKAMRNIYDSENEYNRACLDAICGNVDQAIELLRIALEKKQTYVEWIIHDPDLDFIREDARFKRLISNYTA